MLNIVQIKVCPEDRDKMRSSIKKLFLDNNPHMHGARVTDKMLFKEVIRYYVEGS